jgi:hypothetical protein
MSPSADTVMQRSARALWLAFTAALVIAAAAAFQVPALRRTGVWPAPLDDVYIHFDFARSIAQGHPFEWIPGNGYSSGATSLVYPFVLAAGWAVGFRGAWLGLFAALVACASLVDLCRSLRALAGSGPAWLPFLFPPLVLCVPLLDWSLFSGMEVALFGAVLGRALVAVRRAEEAPPASRARAQRRAGALAALLVAVRPEAAAIALPLAGATALSAGTLSAAGSLARAAGPTIALLAAQAAVNRALTGEWAAAGAVRKLVLADPYATRLDTAIEVLKNLVALRTQAFDLALGGWPGSAVMPLLALVALVDPRSRRLAAALVLGALGTVLLVALNATARFQNFRYAAPALLMLVAAAALGLAALARRGRRFCLPFTRIFWLPKLALVAGLAAIVAPRGAFEHQIDRFARASANIREQQVEVGLRLAARSPAPRRVLVSDAGAIPYFSRLPALDGLGLGGFHDLPFARASVHGVPSVVELIERMAPADRPDVLAVYPGWWPGLADVFGRRFDAVRIEDNVICGADEKVLYDADFSPLARPGERRPRAIDELDVADLVSERAHEYVLPAPRGGWTIGAVLALEGGARRFDGGRLVPQGREERFRVSEGVAPGPATIVLRTDGGPPQAIRVVVEREGRPRAVADAKLDERPRDRWTEVSVPILDVASGDTVRVASLVGAFRDFHVWIVR